MSSAIKVAQCLAGAPYGGAEKFYTRLVAALANEPSLIQRAFTRENATRVPALRDANVQVETFRFGTVFNPLGNKKYLAALKTFAPDVVITYMNRASILTPPGDYQLVCRLGHYYNLKYYRHADHWIGISKGICKHLIDGGMPADRVYHIPNFADETIVQSIDRTSFDTPAGVPLILAAGRLHVNKGFDILIRALKGIPEAYLWLAGDGPKKSVLTRLCQNEGVAERVRFLGWRNDVAALMRSVDLFVCPSRHEGLGSIVMESWFNECPIVATASQGPGELIDHGNTGLLSPVDDIDQLQRNLVAAMNDQQLRNRLRENGSAEYQARYSKAVITKQYRSLLETITHRK